MTYMNIGLKLFFGLIALLLVTRLLGKKEISQLTPFDFVYSIVLGGILEESIYDNKISALHVWFAVAVWGLLFIGIRVNPKNGYMMNCARKASLQFRDFVCGMVTDRWIFHQNLYE